MWIARDKDGILNLFTYMPHRNEVNWTGRFIGLLTEDRYWDEDPIIDIIEGFENLKWEDEPIEVEIVSKTLMDSWREKYKWEMAALGIKENNM